LETVSKNLKRLIQGAKDQLKGLVCNGYIDIGFNVTLPLPKMPVVGAGFSAGIQLQLGEGQVYPYGGFNAGTTGVSVVIARSGSQPSKGWSGSYSVAGGPPVGVYPFFAAGHSGPGSPVQGAAGFGEIGAAFGTPGAGYQDVQIFGPFGSGNAGLGACK
jgi:hypothetical protein